MTQNNRAFIRQTQIFPGSGPARGHVTGSLQGTVIILPENQDMIGTRRIVHGVNDTRPIRDEAGFICICIRPSQDQAKA